MKYKLSTIQLIISWIAQIVAALIMLQTLYFKFSGAEESIFIFSSLGMEPWGRYGTGIMELIASILLLIPSLAWLGSVITFLLMSGAVFFHLTILGVSVEMDHGTLFELALITLVASVIVFYIRRSSVPFIARNL